MNIDEVGGGGLMKAADLESTPRGRLVHISAVTVQSIRNGHDVTVKAVVHFEEADKGLALNSTNKSVLRNHYGRETDDWVGEPVVLYLVDDKYMDRPCKAIRVRPPKLGYSRRPPTQPLTRGAGAAPPVPTRAMVAVNGRPDTYVAEGEDDVPF